MIPLHELRVGNFVLDEFSEKFLKVESGSDIDQLSKKSKAIPVTQDLLRKCGFLFHDYFKIWQKNKSVSGTGPDMELDPDFWVLDFAHRRIGIEIESLHQMQNVYFILKSKELEIAW